MDGYLANRVISIKRRLKRQWDFVGIVDGMEGGGKTTFAFQLCKAVDPTFNIDRVCFNEEQFNEQILKCKPGDAICLDEAMNVFFKRTTMSSINILMVRVLAECRKRNLFLLFVMPSFFEMDRYPALHRASCLIHIYTIVNEKGDQDRGYFRYYDRDKKKKLYLKGRKEMIYEIVKPSFYGRFSKEFVIPKKEYESKKDKALLEKQQDKGGKRDAKVTKSRNICIKLLQKDKEAEMNKQEFGLWLRSKGVSFQGDILND